MPITGGASSGSGVVPLVGADYVEVLFNNTNGTDLTSADHVKFNTLVRQVGTRITADITTPYTSAANVNSLGRFLLQPGSVYELEGDIGDTGGLNGYTNFRWWNADTNAEITPGTGGGTINGANLSGTNASRPYAKTTFLPPVPTRVEMRWATGASFTGHGGQFSANRATARIRTLDGQIPITGQTVDMFRAGFIGSAFTGGGQGVAGTVSANPQIAGTSFVNFINNFTASINTGAFTVSASGITCTKTGIYSVNFKADVNTTTTGASGSQLLVAGAVVDFAKYGENSVTANTDGQLNLNWSGQITAGSSIQVAPIRESAGGSDTYVTASIEIIQIGSGVQLGSSGVWTNYTPVVTGIGGTNPTLPTGAVISGSYAVFGKTMLLNLNFSAATTAGGADGTGSYAYSLPAGFSIDLTKAPLPSVVTNVAGSGLDGGSVGSGFGRNAASSSALTIRPLSSNTIGAYAEIATRLIGAGALAMTSGANTAISMTCQIPIL